MVFRNQALMTFAIALGLITAGAYIEKTNSPISASTYASVSEMSYGGISQPYFVESRQEMEVENDTLPSAPAPDKSVEPKLEEDYPCPVDYIKPHTPLPQPKPQVQQNNSCTPSTGCNTGRVYYYYPNGTRYYYPNSCGTQYYNGCNYNHWHYRPCQPVRNTVRFFHNHRPIRRGVGCVARGVGRLFCWR